MAWPADEYVEPSYVPIWRRKRWLFAGALILVAITATLYIIHGRSEIARQLAAIRARGEPTSLDELETYPGRPPFRRMPRNSWRSWRACRWRPTGLRASSSMSGQEPS